VAWATAYADEFAEVLALLADGALQVADQTSESQASTAALPLSSGYASSTMKILVAPNGP
jgi:hypothetical protein